MYAATRSAGSNMLHGVKTVADGINDVTGRGCDDYCTDYYLKCEKLRFDGPQVSKAGRARRRKFNSCVADGECAGAIAKACATPPSCGAPVTCPVEQEPSTSKPNGRRATADQYAQYNKNLRVRVHTKTD